MSLQECIKKTKFLKRYRITESTAQSSRLMSQCEKTHTCLKEDHSFHTPV